MGFQIEDGIGEGFTAKVNSEGQLSTESLVHELQHHISWRHGQAYQLIGDHTLGGAGTKTLLHLENIDPNRNLIVSYMRVQYPGGDGTIDAATYFQLGLGRTYSSGGVAVSPVNMNQTSGNVASVTAYDDSPTLAGTFTEIDRWYPDKSMQTFNKHGSLILGLSDTLEWRLVTDQVAGLAYVRLTMMMLDK